MSLHELVRDVTAVLVLANGLIIVVRYRRFISIAACIVLFVFSWFVLARREPAINLPYAFVQLYMLLVVTRILSPATRERLNGRIVGLFGRRAKQRWEEHASGK